VTPRGDLFGRREPPRGACGAARHRRFVVGSRGGACSSRCWIPSPSRTAFNGASFHALHTGAARRLFRTYRRPPTSCAHRLRKPDRTRTLLTPSVARRALERQALTCRPRRPIGWSRVGALPFGHASLCDPPPRQARQARRRFRTANTVRTRAPSAGSPRALRPEWFDLARFFTRAVSPTPSSLAASEPASSQAWRVASSYPCRRVRVLSVAGPNAASTTESRCLSPTSATSRHFTSTHDAARFRLHARRARLSTCHDAIVPARSRPRPPHEGEGWPTGTGLGTRLPLAERTDRWSPA
jgi:hypothetical protein